MLKVNDKSPANIKALNSEGKEVSLSKYLGKYIVLYFYPKDNTSGCTKEACGFIDFNSKIKVLGAEIIGVSKDDIKSHNKFIDKYNINFELWSDISHELMEAFGVWGEKKFMGKTYIGAFRSTFILDPKGIIINVWDKVKPEIHAKEVYEFLKGLIN